MVSPLQLRNRLTMERGRVSRQLRTWKKIFLSRDFELNGKMGFIGRGYFSTGAMELVKESEVVGGKCKMLQRDAELGPWHGVWERFVSLLWDITSLP